MIDDRYYVKIVPRKGDRIHRFWVRRRHVAAALGGLALVIAGTLAFAGLQAARAQALARQAAAQRTTLQAIDRRTDALRSQIQRVQKQNQEIRQLIGAPSPHLPAVRKTSWAHAPATVGATVARVRALERASESAQRDSNRMEKLAMHVLNVRHLRNLERAQLVAAIPSIDPVSGAQVVGCYCYRSYPDTEFHRGVDLGAGYGDAVHAAAAGTVVANGYDGSYGIKIDIDHGNGYHTWYAHLSRAEVAVGQHVYKGETIAQVGATGFATGPHLHYQVMYRGQAIDPTPFLNGIPANVLAALP